MKRLLGLLSGLVVSALVLFWSAPSGRAQVKQPAADDFGPGDGGATLKQPWGDDTVKPVAPQPKATPKSGATAPTPAGKSAYLQNMWNQQSSPTPPADPFTSKLQPGFSGQLPQEPVDINKDLAVSTKQGPWMICVYSYMGKEAPQMARDLALELRDHHKLQAFVFNYGAEERQKELARIRALLDKQREFLEKNKLSLDTPLRARHVRIEDQCAVLVGGYGDPDTARRHLDHVRNLKIDTSRVKFYEKIVIEFDKADGQARNEKSPFFAKWGFEKPKEGKGTRGYGKPFSQAFVCRNPTIKAEPPPEQNQLDIKVLRKLNAGEPFSLLDCPKPMTLAIKQFQTPSVLESKNQPGNLFEKLGMVKGERVDAAAHSAHNLAELLRKARLESYVLHTRYASVVTVGAFESLDDPNLKNMQQILGTRVRDQLQALQLFPEPVPMMVPR